MTPKHNIGDLVRIYSPALHGVIGIVLRKRHAVNENLTQQTKYEVKRIDDNDYTMWYPEKWLRKIKE